MSVMVNEVFALKIKKLLIGVRIYFSSLFIASIVASLCCAYLGEANLIVITISLLIGSLHGIYSIIRIYQTIGFDRYYQQVAKINDE
ncbi:hypothetical protein [Thalassotalea sp. ND16A]|uniref:hypothetical protein n=1 Tax=Thalassotalea sp. ND16A TaxID=1535422 RepID=UPI00051A5ED6|nr:hypothetical protein [Thalassotalea sp. ND16A]KGJ98533.1 hypothetical protein ND16A_0603 [Thalassotalea sp. ND16A]